MFSYGHNYLDGVGDIILVYPMTDAFNAPFPVFEFPKSIRMRLWVLPFCLKTCRLKVPDSPNLKSIFFEEPTGRTS